MRTTIELADDLIATLHALAVKKGLRGYSKIMEEAVTHYLKDNEEKEKNKATILKMRGSWPRSEAEKITRSLGEIRKNWKK
jgi:metal-responsive CopG/Arc/MetJ family transcriptional regulator